MPVSGHTLTDLFRWIDLIAVFANALLGGVIARRERLDPIGEALPRPGEPPRPRDAPGE